MEPSAARRSRRRPNHEHENPDEATVDVLHGRLGAGDDHWEGSPDDLIVAPDARHDLEVLGDSLVLLTVAKLA